MNSLWLPQRPVWFFGLYALTILLLLPLWNGLADWYMVVLVGLVNNVSTWASLPPQFQVGALPQEGAVNPGIVAGMALFIVTPNRSVSWKLAWIVALVLFWWVLQAALLLLQLQVAYAHFLTQLSWPQRLGYYTTVVSPLLSSSSFASFVESGHYWTSPMCNFLIWIVAAGRR